MFALSDERYICTQTFPRKRCKKPSPASHKLQEATTQCLKYDDK